MICTQNTKAGSALSHSSALDSAEQANPDPHQCLKIKSKKKTQGAGLLTSTSHALSLSSNSLTASWPLLMACAPGTVATPLFTCLNCEPPFCLFIMCNAGTCHCWASSQTASNHVLDQQISPLRSFAQARPLMDNALCSKGE